MTSTDIRRRLGDTGEGYAAAHLERLGFAIVTRNHRTRHGELDIVACDGHTLVIAEVKTRREGGRPWESLHPRTRAQVRRMAAEYLATVTDRPRVPELRLDAIGIVLDAQDRLLSLEHLEGAI
jgi:putative endonuclease